MFVVLGPLDVLEAPVELAVVPGAVDRLPDELASIKVKEGVGIGDVSSVVLKPRPARTYMSDPCPLPMIEGLLIGERDTHRIAKVASKP